MPLPSRVKKYWPLIQASAAKYGLDEYLLAAILDRESLCGLSLTPEGPTGTGDGGHGRGLGQIDDRSHAEFCAVLQADGTPLWADPAANIDESARILASNRPRFTMCCAPSVALIAAYNCGAGRVIHALMHLTQPTSAAAELSELDQLCTGGDYVSDVLRRRAQFAAPPPTTEPLPNV